MSTPPERPDAPATRPNPLARFAPLLRVALGLAAALIVTVILFNNVVMPTFVGRGNVTKVPDVTGKDLTQAQALLTKAGLTPGETRERNDPKPAGTVIRQQPQAGNSVKEGRPIILTLSLGEPGRSVPTLAQESIRNAELALGMSTSCSARSPAPSDRQHPTDLVVASQPPAGTTLSRGSTVDILVSAGTSRRSNGYVMPNLVGGKHAPRATGSSTPASR
jgi:serine/threonine-protein kinase